MSPNLPESHYTGNDFEPYYPDTLYKTTFTAAQYKKLEML